MSKTRFVLVLALSLGLLAPAMPASAAIGAIQPACRSATGILGGVLGAVGGLLSGLGVGRAVPPVCDVIPAAAAPVPLVNGLAANLATSCWQVAKPIADLGLTGVYVVGARACGNIGAASVQGTWNALYAACAQAAPAIGAQGMVLCFRTVGQLKATHDAAMAAIQNIR